MAFDRAKALFDEAMPCGMSSRFVQVTVVPAFTVKAGGVKVKLSIDMAADGPGEQHAGGQYRADNRTKRG